MRVELVLQHGHSPHSSLHAGSELHFSTQILQAVNSIFHYSSLSNRTNAMKNSADTRSQQPSAQPLSLDFEAQIGALLVASETEGPSPMRVPTPLDVDGLVDVFCLGVVACATIFTFLFWMFQMGILAAEICSPTASTLTYLAGVFGTFGLPAIFGIIIATWAIYCISQCKDYLRGAELTTYITISCGYVLLMGLVFMVAALQWSINVCLPIQHTSYGNTAIVSKTDGPTNMT